MEHIRPLVGDVFMEPRHLQFGLLPPLTPLCFSGELALKTGKFLLALAQVAVVFVIHTIGGNSK